MHIFKAKSKCQPKESSNIQNNGTKQMQTEGKKKQTNKQNLMQIPGWSESGGRSRYRS